MHGEIQFSCLIDQDAKDVILKRAVVFVGGNAAGMVFRVDGLRFVARRIAEIEAAKVRGVKFYGQATFLLIVGDGLACEGFIAGKVSGQGAYIFLLHVAMQNFFLQGDVYAHVGVLAGLVAIVQRKEERIDEENPVEALGIEIWRQSNTVREAGLDIEPVQDALPIGGSPVLLRRFFFFREPLAIFRLKNLVGIAKQRFHRSEQFRIGVAPS